MRTVDNPLRRLASIEPALFTVAAVVLGPFVVILGTVLAELGYPSWGGVTAALGVFFFAVLVLSKVVVRAITVLSK